MKASIKQDRGSQTGSSKDRMSGIPSYLSKHHFQTRRDSSESCHSSRSSCNCLLNGKKREKTEEKTQQNGSGVISVLI